MRAWTTRRASRWTGCAGAAATPISRRRKGFDRVARGAARARFDARALRDRSSTRSAGSASSRDAVCAAATSSARCSRVEPVTPMPTDLPTRERDRAHRARPRVSAEIGAKPCTAAHFLLASAAAGRRRFSRRGSRVAQGAGRPTRKLLVLVELKGGNDGLNTVVPYADPAYYALRPRIAIARDQVAAARRPRGPASRRSRRSCRSWQTRELAMRAGRRLSRVRTCRTSARSRSGTRRSRSDEYLTKAGLRAPSPRRRCPTSSPPTASIVGASELGPLAGGGARAIALADTEQFLRRARSRSRRQAQGNTRARAHPAGRGRHRAGRVAA